MSWLEAWTVVQGAGVTILVSLASLAVGLPLGLCLALVRWSRVPVLDPAAAVLVSLLRAIPAVTLVLLVYFALTDFGLSLTRFEAAVATLGLGTMAFTCEVLRGALLALDRDQLDAALSVGMGRTLRMRRIVLPQVFRMALPGLVNEVTLLIKASPAVAVIGLVEATRAAVRIGAATYEPIPPLLLALALYVSIIACFVLLQRMLERRARLAAG